MSQIHNFELKNGRIFLDGIRIKGIRSFNILAKENDSLVELSLKMDVRTLGGNGIPEFDNSLNKIGEIGNGNID